MNEKTDPITNMQLTCAHSPSPPQSRTTRCVNAVLVLSLSLVLGNSFLFSKCLLLIFTYTKKSCWPIQHKIIPRIVPQLANLSHGERKWRKKRRGECVHVSARDQGKNGRFLRYLPFPCKCDDEIVSCQQQLSCALITFISESNSFCCHKSPKSIRAHARWSGLWFWSKIKKMKFKQTHTHRDRQTVTDTLGLMQLALRLC